MLIHSAGMKQTLQYDQTSCRLQVEGLPDVSLAAGGGLGIITGWRLQWLGRPDLEGQRDHLQALVGVVIPYARYRISGVPRPFGEPGAPVAIRPAGIGRHQLLLNSRQPETPPLELEIDDAELADLVQVLDRLRLDPRLQLQVEIPSLEPLRRRELVERIPRRRRLAAPLGGLAALAITAALGSLWLAPRPIKPGGPTGTPVTRSNPAAPGARPAPASPLSLPASTPVPPR